jgi:Ca2+-binding EF-hand superfamily protein
MELFNKIDVDKNGSIEAEEFHDLLSSMGFPVPKGQVLELLRKADDNFDGRITYKELKLHLVSLGFDVEKLESGNEKIQLQ